jgi:hypothetical protein
VGEGVSVYKGAAPKTGTRLTPDRISHNLESLNSGHVYGVRKGRTGRSK